jgi:hypothetical protein
MARMRGPVFLSAEEENDLIDELAAEYIRDWTEPDMDVIPGHVLSPFAEPDKDMELMLYGQITLPSDYALLMDPEYVDRMRTGELPKPESPYWLALTDVPLYLEEELKSFRRVVGPVLKSLV